VVLAGIPFVQLGGEVAAAIARESCELTVGTTPSTDPIRACVTTGRRYRINPSECSAAALKAGNVRFRLPLNHALDTGFGVLLSIRESGYPVGELAPLRRLVHLPHSASNQQDRCSLSPRRLWAQPGGFILPVPSPHYRWSLHPKRLRRPKNLNSPNPNANPGILEPRCIFKYLVHGSPQCLVCCYTYLLLLLCNDATIWMI
jgi:hypothetical protein